MAYRKPLSTSSILVMRNSLGQTYSKGVELTHAELARILPEHTKYNLITSKAYRSTAPDGAVSTLALSECEKMIRTGTGGQKWKIRTVYADDIRKSQTNSYRKIADFIIKSNVHLSLDVDILDPTEMAGTATPAPNGVYLNQVLTIMGVVNSSSKNYYATDIMEYNPKKFNGDSTAASKSRDSMRAILGFVV